MATGTREDGLDRFQPHFWAEHAELCDESWQACSWGSRRSQEDRFVAILEDLKPRRGEILLDWGCGTGDLSAYIPDGVQYVGADPCEAMLDRAGREHPEHVFASLDDCKDKRFDLIVAVGAWNMRPWLHLETYRTICELWRNTRRAFAASMLRARGARTSDDTNLRYDPAETARVANLIASKFALRTDHLPHDLIVELYR